MKIMREWFDELEADMVKKFEDHNDKYQNDFSLDTPFEKMKATTSDILRNEAILHQAKWLYRGVYKKDLKETDTITNHINVLFLLWIRLKLEEGIKNDPHHE